MAARQRRASRQMPAFRDSHASAAVETATLARKPDVRVGGGDVVRTASKALATPGRRCIRKRNERLNATLHHVEGGSLWAHSYTGAILASRPYGLFRVTVARADLGPVAHPQSRALRVKAHALPRLVDTWKRLERQRLASLITAIALSEGIRRLSAPASRPHLSQPRPRFITLPYRGLTSCPQVRRLELQGIEPLPGYGTSSCEPRWIMFASAVDGSRNLGTRERYRSPPRPPQLSTGRIDN